MTNYLVEKDFLGSLGGNESVKRRTVFLQQYRSIYVYLLSIISIYYLSYLSVDKESVEEGYSGFHSVFIFSHNNSPLFLSTSYNPSILTVSFSFYLFENTHLSKSRQNGDA